jgi:hypothetical protein
VSANLKLYPELSSAALRGKHHRELALWYELRALNYWGSGWLNFADATSALVSVYGYRHRTLRAILNSGDGTFWRLHKNAHVSGRTAIEIYSLYKVTLYFEISYLRRPVSVTIQEWLQNRKSWLYASFFKPKASKKAKPISRESIRAATGVSKRQQRRYELTTGIQRTANFAFHEPGVPMLMLVDGKLRQWETIRRLGNAYISPAISAPLGLVKKVNRRLRSLFSDEARQPRFFFSARSALQARDKDEDSFFIIPMDKRLIRNRKEWQSTVL